MPEAAFRGRRTERAAGKTMKCFTVTEAKVAPSLKVSMAPYPHIGVGEEGRGRTYVRFPVAQRFAASLAERIPCPARRDRKLVLPSWSKSMKQCECGETYQPCGGDWYEHPDRGERTVYRSIERASVIRTREKRTLLLVEEQNPQDQQALVLVNVSAGFRGSTHWCGAGRTPCPRRGETLAYEWQCPTCGCMLPAGSQLGHCIHPADQGWIYDDVPNTLTALAEGWEAQGDAGRMGGHVVKLIIMEPGCVFQVIRSGRLYGEPAHRYVAWDGETLRLGTRDEIWPPADELPEGEVV